MMCVVEITLGSPGPACSAERLVYVELQRLRSISIADIEPQVVCEMAHIVSPAERNPVELIGIRVSASQRKLRRRTVEGRSCLVERECRLRYAKPCCASRVRNYRRTRHPIRAILYVEST